MGEILEGFTQFADRLRHIGGIPIGLDGLGWMGEAVKLLLETQKKKKRRGFCNARRNGNALFHPAGDTERECVRVS